LSFFRNNIQTPLVESFSTTFTTAVTPFFPAEQLTKVAIRIVIDNQDPTNALTFTKNGVGGTVFTIPPNSIAIIENELIDGIVVTPNAVTGVGQITADLAVRSELVKGGFIA